jgi:hypothetical protein
VRRMGISSGEPASGQIETEVIDLSEMSITDLRFCDEAALTPSLSRVLHQVERPRLNIGSTGPGRVD